MYHVRDVHHRSKEIRWWRMRYLEVDVDLVPWLRLITVLGFQKRQDVENNKTKLYSFLC
jgi:hypothetical protein